jgi:hypothetical protein
LYTKHNTPSTGEVTVFVRNIVALSLAAVSMPAPAQQNVSVEVAKSVVKQTNEIISKRYVFPEKAGVITAKLNASLAAGRYANVGEPELAQRLTQDMQAVTNDKHMTVRFDPVQAKALLGSSGSGPSPEQVAYFQALGHSTNFGVPEMKVLPGNVRYINLAPMWIWDPKYSPQVFDDAMRFLSGGDAYIIDVRSNGGGNATGVRYVISHFLNPDEKLMTYYIGGAAPSESRTHKVPGAKLDKPLYVLTSPASVSASEEFVAHVKNFKLGSTAGGTTAGGGHRNALTGIPEGFVVSVSIGTAIHPVTNAGWEANGFKPDIAVSVPAALDAAHLDALKKLKASATGPKAAQLQWAMDGLAAKLNPVKLTPAELEAYAGSYASGRQAVVRDGKLFWQLGAREVELVPLSKDLFAFGSGPEMRVRFDREGAGIKTATEIAGTGAQTPLARAS